MLSLPKTLPLFVRFECRAPGRLPALWTTALHGTLFASLRELACLQPGRDDCAACPRASECSYAMLAEPVGDPSAGEGITDRAPPALVLAPEGADFSKPAFELRVGSSIQARLTLIGERAIEHRSLLVGALNQAARKLHGGSSRDGFVRLVAAEPVGGDPRPCPSRVRLRFVTPVRLKADGRIRGELSADTLWRALARRADSLSRLYGDGPLGVDPSSPAPFALERVESRVVSVQRWSNRQRTSMAWPGVLGAAVLEGPRLEEAWPILEFGERAQVGKATSFGFGRYALGDATAEQPRLSSAAEEEKA